MKSLATTLLEQDRLGPGSGVKTIRNGRIHPLQVVRDDGGDVFTVDPKDPRQVNKVRRDQMAPIGQEDEEDEELDPKNFAKVESLIQRIQEGGDRVVVTASGERLHQITDPRIIRAVTSLPEDAFGWWDGSDERVYDEGYQDLLPMMGSGEVWQCENDGFYWYFKDPDSVGLADARELP